MDISLASRVCNANAYAVITERERERERVQVAKAAASTGYYTGYISSLIQGASQLGIQSSHLRYLAADLQEEWERKMQ